MKIHAAINKLLSARHNFLDAFSYQRAPILKSFKTKLHFNISQIQKFKVENEI